ncbi:MAG: hypothetical protein V8S28_08140 [Lachnospiraceae bacterium]
MSDLERKNQLIQAYQRQEEYIKLKKQFFKDEANKGYMYFILSKLVRERVEDKEIL